MKSTTTDTEWITTAEAGRILGVTAQTARNWALMGELDAPHQRVKTWINVGPGDRYYRIRRNVVEAYLRRKEAA